MIAECRMFEMICILPVHTVIHQKSRIEEFLSSRGCPRCERDEGDENRMETNQNDDREMPPEHE
jgi:hypothetical protein